MFDYLIDRLLFFHTELLNEQSYFIREQLIVVIQAILKALPKEFDPKAYVSNE